MRRVDGPGGRRVHVMEGAVAGAPDLEPFPCSVATTPCDTTYWAAGGATTYRLRGLLSDDRFVALVLALGTRSLGQMVKLADDLQDRFRGTGSLVGSPSGTPEVSPTLAGLAGNMDSSATATLSEAQVASPLGFGLPEQLSAAASDMSPTPKGET